MNSTSSTHLCYFSREVDGGSCKHDLSRAAESPLYASSRGRGRGRGGAGVLRTAVSCEREEAVFAHCPGECGAKAHAHAALDFDQPALHEAVRRRRHDAHREAHQLLRRGQHACNCAVAASVWDGEQDN